jgi:hypothetical protein
MAVGPTNITNDNCRKFTNSVSTLTSYFILFVTIAIATYDYGGWLSEEGLLNN